MQVRHRLAFRQLTPSPVQRYISGQEKRWFEFPIQSDLSWFRSCGDRRMLAVLLVDEEMFNENDLDFSTQEPERYFDTEYYVSRALRRVGYSVIAVPATQNLEATSRKLRELHPDLVFNSRPAYWRAKIVGCRCGGHAGGRRVAIYWSFGVRSDPGSKQMDLETSCGQFGCQGARELRLQFPTPATHSRNAFSGA